MLPTSPATGRASGVSGRLRDGTVPGATKASNAPFMAKLGPTICYHFPSFPPNIGNYLEDFEQGNLELSGVKPPSVGHHENWNTTCPKGNDGCPAFPPLAGVFDVVQIEWGKNDMWQRPTEKKRKKTLIAAHKPSSDEYLWCAEIEIHFFLIGQKTGFTDTAH